MANAGFESRILRYNVKVLLTKLVDTFKFCFKLLNDRDRFASNKIGPGLFLMLNVYQSEFTHC